MKIRLPSLEQLVKICEGMVARAASASTSTWRTHYAHGFFEKATFHGRSMITLLEALRDDNPSSDIAGICTLSRCIVEVHNAFAYLCEPGLTQDESNLRHQLFLLNHESDRRNINTELGIESPNERSFFNEVAYNWTLEALETNTVFQSLDAPHRKNLLRGKSPYLVKRYKGPRPLPRNIESAAYKLFSHNVHSYSFGLSPKFGGDLTPAGSVNMLLLAVEVAIVYLASISLLYWRLRSRAVRTLPSTEKEFLRNCTSSEAVQAWLNNLKSARADAFI